MQSTLTTVAMSASASADSRDVSVQIRKRTDKDFELDLSIALLPGITILFGPSGAGKTTLLDGIAGLTPPDAGRIAIAQRVFFDSTAGTNVPTRRRKVGYVFQDVALFPHLSVEGNVEYGISSLPAKERQLRSTAILQSFGIAHLGSRRPGQISGGARQRAALARALVSDR